MALMEAIKKRKQPSQTKDEPEHSSSEPEFTINDLEEPSSPAQSGSEESDFLEVDEDDLEDEEELESDEIESDEDEEDEEEPLVVKNGQHHDTEKDSIPNYTIETDANGNTRYVYKDIDPVYDSDDSDAPENANTIGNIPLSFYDAYPHIGYDINGKRIMRPAKGEALDALLDTVEIPKGWTGLTDPATGKPLQLSQEELEVLRKIGMDEVPEEGYDPYQPTIEYFTSITETMPLSAAPEPKRRFIPSKHEAQRVLKIVRAIREGRIQPYKPPDEQDQDDLDIARHDIWANEKPRPDHPMNMPAPKLPPPGYDESYNPPPEYLPSNTERKAWEEADEEDRDKEYLPQRYDSLRKVPGYDRFLKERFERSLDLYLAPRIRRIKRNIDPESLLPKLPNPDELRPFPTMCATIYQGHEGRVRSLAIDPSGVWLASGGDDGTVRLWELLTGRQLWHVKLSSDEPVHVVRWRPGLDAFILAAAAGTQVYMISPPTIDPEIESTSRTLLDAGWGHASTINSNDKKPPPAQWTRPGSRLEESNVLIRITLRSPVKVISWHRRGDYFVTVSPQGQTQAVAVHTLSKHLTQIPFRRLKGLAQSSAFHPSKPILFVATQRTIRSYDLVRQELIKTLQPGARWISSFDIHPGGDNLIVGSYDRRLLWHDLDLSMRPYKTLRYHSKAIRAVKYHHGGLPLFVDASDDGSLQVFHGKVVGDLMENATIVPLKVLRGHLVKQHLGVLDVDWHPREPWCVSAGADGTCRLWM
ncbi:MAG: Ribosome biogenesis protein erb1 [Watsoniomyces obsoletus]|nr:MAG: Ribosome biogenesis protein erb1 [Watsoniomyces obsoletus]